MTAHATCAASAATSARDGVPLTVWTVVVSSQSGAPSGTRFWKNDGPPAPFGKRCMQHRAAAHRAHERLGDRGVVADEVELRLAALGEQDLAGARDPHLAPGELEHLRVVCRHDAHRTGQRRCVEEQVIAAPGAAAAARDRREVVGGEAGLRCIARSVP